MGLLVEALQGQSRTWTKILAPAGRPVATALTLMVADATALLAAGGLGLGLWSLVNPEIGADFYLSLWPALVVFLVVFALYGLYPGVGMSPVEEMRSTVVGTTLIYLVASASIFLAKEVENYSRGVFLSAWALSVILVPLCRALARRLFAAKSWWGVPVLVLGAGKTGRMIVERLKKQPALGWKPVAYLDDDDTRQEDQDGIPVAGPLSSAPGLARALGIRYALVAMPGVDRKALLGVLERMGSVFPHLIVVPDLLGMASLWVSTRDFAGVLGLEVKQNLLSPLNRWMKRALDLATAILVAIPSLPLVAISMLWIKRVSPGPALYFQEREGEDGRKIRVPKLRTMHLDSDQLLLQHLEGDADARDEWQRYFKLKRDPRILPGIGRFLRRTSLDELPQLWNIIKGEMSLVGPRPFPYYHLDQFDREFRALRRKVLPGLTGLWQVSARSDGDLPIQQTLDSYYIRNWSLWLDLHILACTVRAVLFRQGAY